LNVFFKKEKLKKKFFGQNFLTDKHVIQTIIKCIKPKKTDYIVEIGPGKGALTLPLTNLTKNLFAIEIDTTLCKQLQKYKKLKTTKIFHSDVLSFNFFKIQKKNKLIRIVGNLPYNISVPILFYLIKYKNVIKDMHFMLQKEVVEKLTAKVHSPFYNRLTVMLQLHFKIRLIKKVLPKSFSPIPKVDSCFISIKKTKNKEKKTFLRFPEFNKITKIAFEQRRKMIRNSLSSLFNKTILINLGIDPTLRAQNLSIKQYCLLSNYLYLSKK